MRVRLLSHGQRSAYLGLTYPAYRDQVLRLDDTDSIAVGGDLDDRPVGFAFAALIPGAWEIGSIHVRFDDPLGTLRAPLLHAVMAEAGRRGWGLGVFHPTYDSDDRSLIALMQASGWSGPGIRQISARTTVDKMLSLWFVRLGELRPGYAVVPWRTMTPAMHASVAQASAQLPDAVKEDLCPLKYEARADLDVSFVLLREGQAIGWHLPERLNQTTYRWTCSAVAPNHWSMAAVILLWVPALYAQQKTGVAGLIWGVPVVHANMVRFVFRRLKPALDSITIGATFQLAAARTNETRAGSSLGSSGRSGLP